MGQVIFMPEDQCGAVGLLLPWHASGTLDPHDEATVERHLAQCDRCRTHLAMERRLADAIATDTAAADGGWSALGARLDGDGDRAAIAPAAGLAPRPAPGPGRRTARVSWRRATPPRALAKPSTLRWIVGAQFAALLVLGAMAALPPGRAGQYRALGDVPAAGTRPGNTLAMFRPALSEAALRQALARASARIVDGPTEAGAYVLYVPGGATGPQLAALRAQPGVTMAEPIGQATAE